MAEKLFKNTFLSVLLCILFSCSIYTEDDTCSGDNPCLCKLSNGSFLDISHVVTKENPYLSTRTKDELTYYFHPCKDVKFDSKSLNLTVNITTNECSQGTSLCLYNKTGQSLINLGTATDSRFLTHPKSIVFTRSDKPNVTLTSTIQLICTPDESESYFEPYKRLTDQHQLRLFSSHACWEHEHRGLSTGSTLLILFSIVFGIYLLGGALVLHFLRGARGKEMIPNLDFWTDLPYLVRDGLVFLLNGCNPMSVSNAETYDRI